LTISIGKFFDNPIADFKAIFPAYSVKVTRDTIDYNYDYAWNSSPVFASISVNQAGYYYYSRTYSSYGGDYANGNISIPAFDQEFARMKQTILAVPNVAYAYLSLSWGQNLYAAGTYSISGAIDYGYETREPELAIYVPEITWQADDFSQWILPNPTLNGILPGMTDSQFKQTFGITAMDWEKTVRFDYLD
jgi:hypothetical protein